MSKTTLTALQMKALAPYEPHMNTAINAGYCSYPGQMAISKMIEIWEDLTGSAYNFRAGCSVCIFHLVRDLGTLYFSQKAADEKKKREKAAETASKKKGGATTQPEGEKPAQPAKTAKASK